MSSIVIVFATSMRYWVMALGFSPQPSHLLRRRLRSAWFLAVGFASSCSGGGDGPGIVNPPLPVPGVVHVWIVSPSGPPGIPTCSPEPFSIGITKQAYALAQDWGRLEALM
jgi:hypothetical protein